MFTRLKNFFSKTHFFSLLLLMAFNSTIVQGQEIIFQENFESGWGKWYADNGVWDIGKAIIGPDTAHSGLNVAGTVLTGNYPPSANTRLISPAILLPAVNSNERILLYIWQWFRMNEGDTFGSDLASIQISVNDHRTWINLHTDQRGYSSAWTQLCLDITKFSNARIRIAFNFVSTFRAEDNGIYLDDIIIKKMKYPLYILSNPEDFEGGAGNWSASNGVWEIGKPKSGPPSAHSGQYCAGTILSGNYPPYSNTWLVSPEIKLITKPNQIPELFFWHWYRMNKDDTFGPDEGYIRISVNGKWRPDPIVGPYTGNSVIWTQGYVNLSDYADSTIRIAFAFYSTFRTEDVGWYIDDIRIEGIACKGDVNFDGILNELDVFLIADIYLEKFSPTVAELWAADCNDDGDIDIADIYFVIDDFLRNAHIDISSPNGGEKWQVDVAQTIRWDPSIVSSKVKLEISVNAGNDWISIADSTENDGEYTWTPTSDFISENCKIKITSITSSSVFDISGNVFTISFPGEKIVEFTYDFPFEGWHLISLPIIPQDSSVKILFPEVVAAFAFENNNYINVTKLIPGKGYWILILRPIKAVINGLPFKNYIAPYASGWQLIGSIIDTLDFSYPNDNPDGSVVACYGWDSNSKTYHLIYPNGTRNLLPGEGYWIATMQSCTIRIGYFVFNTFEFTHHLQENYMDFSTFPPPPPETGSVLDLPIFNYADLTVNNFPNPFNATTKIIYSLPKAGPTRIFIYNALGQLVKILLNSSQPEGVHHLFWEGDDENGLPVGNGLYFCRIEHLGMVKIQKMVVLK